jgi:anthranilate phosphoribosyltransferase
MLAAFVQQSRLACAGLAQAPAGPAVVVLYAFGTARREPSLAALLALQIAALGTPVLIVTHDARRGANTATVLRALGRTACPSAAAATAALREQCLAWWPIESLAPPLARLLARRAELGFRNSAQALVKLLAPVEGPAVVVANYTHAPYRASFAAAVQVLGLSALLVRGTEGDPVAWEAQAHPSLAWRRGAALSIEPTAAEPASSSPPLPAAADVAATARFIEAAAAGSVAVPLAIVQQARLLAALASAAATAT